VWLRPLPAAAAAALPPLYAGAPAVPRAESDQLLGCAALDMAALRVLGSIEGWYNLSDAADRPKGQIKVGGCWYGGLGHVQLPCHLLQVIAVLCKMQCAVLPLHCSLYAESRLCKQSEWQGCHYSMPACSKMPKLA
jgi:hypothetical protein